jgi:luciferase family oxidoreductase group 1
VDATPGKGTDVPLYILGSSQFGAQLAAVLGLPYAFASHFAPHALEAAVATYRREFRPSNQLGAPYVIAGVNVLAADTEAEARDHLVRVRRARIARFVRGDRPLTDAEADEILASPQGRQLAEMMRFTAVGPPDAVHDYLRTFAVHADADELMVAHAGPTGADRLRSLELLADVSGLVPA